MQSVLIYGRLLSRVFANGLYNFTSGQSSPSQVSPATSSSSLTQPRQESRRPLKFLTAVSGFSKNPSLDRVRPGKFGDDAYFIAKYARGQAIGVADGVGGWRAWGIDPGEFSHGLMLGCKRLFLARIQGPSSKGPSEGNLRPLLSQEDFPSAAADPVKILADAYYELLENKAPILGSSTACLVVLQDRGNGCLLQSANIGDSGYLVVRRGLVVHRSQEQQHYFNTPFQLSFPPPGVSAQVLSDRPESAVRGEFQVEVGDVLLVATDGVFDNLTDALILRELGPVSGTTDPSELQKVANALAQRARTLAFDENYMSPFALSARRNGIEARGGKPDDITVVLATVIPR